MPPKIRLALFLVAAAGFAALFAAGVAGLPPVGHYRGPYGDLVNAIAVPERHITDAVTAVNFDIRAFDTLGEEFIMFASVLGVVLLLRKQPDEREGKPRDQAPGREAPASSDAVRVLTVALVGPVVLFGLYIVTHGQVSPGGGFQGGVILATAPLLVYLAGEFEMLRRIAPPHAMDLAEAAGAGGYAIVGALAMLWSVPFLQNVLPPGSPGDVFSGGTVALLDLTVALEVSGGFILLLITFLEEVLVRRDPV